VLHCGRTTLRLGRDHRTGRQLADVPQGDGAVGAAASQLPLGRRLQVHRVDLLVVQANGLRRVQRLSALLSCQFTVCSAQKVVGLCGSKRPCVLSAPTVACIRVRADRAQLEIELDPASFQQPPCMSVFSGDPTQFVGPHQAHDP